MKKRDKRKAPAAPQPRGMSIDTILAQIASMKDNAKSFIEPNPTDPEGQETWEKDIEACKAATDILTALRDAGIKDTEQVRDLIHDYNALAEQYQVMRRKYEEPVEAVRLGITFVCPECHRQITGYYASHCGYCGKRLGWR